ncbi:hypothetical protein [Legionella hackeliae]|uniref:Uncharacterized protein n=1 Tax=Legionella hackeliae TaxID=449 RepID=A0A0A8UX28_LEGHA|nr:hypothetical protein [Legionella hackeliae]KTD15319.1 hypothetical protein Lhac_0161 [Legionella hackeliae]CEK11314.1 protein of unknown function [Legionella hackeliae]STX48084.1 Uncharacterised protein [Legionella hackeliae]
MPLIYSAIANTTSNLILDVALQVMRQCYEVKHKHRSELAHCMIDVFKSIPNPEHYRINLSGDVPGNFKLVIYNQAGATINCALSAHKKIVVKRCVSYKTAPLSNSQEISITPPN